MADKNQEEPSVGKYLIGLLCGVALTWAYVRFGYELPGVTQIPKAIAAETIIATAETELYAPNATEESRERALSIVLSHQPELLIELDAELGHPLMQEVLRRKAVRKAKLLKGRLSAYDVALGKPALRKHLEQKHSASDTETLKRRMLIADIHDDDFLLWYLREQFPGSGPDDQVELILGVYQHGLTPTQQAAAVNVISR